MIIGGGSIFGGYLSSTLIKRGYSVNRARKTAMGIFAGIIPTVIFASQTDSAWTATQRSASSIAQSVESAPPEKSRPAEVTS